MKDKSTKPFQEKTHKRHANKQKKTQNIKITKQKWNVRFCDIF